MEKSKAMKDDVMRLSSAFWAMINLSDRNKDRYYLDYVPRELLIGDNLETLFYGYLLVMHDINAFDLRGEIPLEEFLTSYAPNKNIFEFGTLLAEGLKKAGEVKVANLVYTMFKSYSALIEASKDKDSAKVNEYKRKVIDSCDKILSLTDNPKMFERVFKEEGGVVLFMSRTHALYLKLVVVGFDKNMTAYEKTARKYAEVFAKVMHSYHNKEDE
ncbi:MAG: hypothetical protein HQL03_12700 [Nitrospirae bacterium]|nr:hypothetical protein [Nitrospirota bacterium]